MTLPPRSNIVVKWDLYASSRASIKKENWLWVSRNSRDIRENHYKNKVCCRMPIDSELAPIVNSTLLPILHVLANSDFDLKLLGKKHPRQGEQVKKCVLI